MRIEYGAYPGKYEVPKEEIPQDGEPTDLQDDQSDHGPDQIAIHQE